MSWIEKRYTQTVVYWSTPTADGAGGYTYATPVEITCRWEDRSDKYIDDNGEEKVSRSVVYTPSDVDVGGYMYLGGLDNLSSAEEADPEIVTNAYRIQAFKKSPSVLGTKYVRKAWL